MKQRRFGEKVINWHRPLRKDGWRQRYARRHATETHERIAAHFNPPLDDWDWDEDLHWVFENAATDIDYAVHAVLGLLGEGGAPQFRALLALIEEPVDGVSDAQPQVAKSATSDALIQLDHLEERLFDHIEQLTKSQELAGWLPTSVRQAVRKPQDLALLRHLASGLNPDSLYHQSGLLCHIVLFAPFWVRPLATWRPQGESSQQRACSLVEHLFVRYPVPQVLTNAWLDDPQRLRLKWLCWLILWGNGYSLHRAADRFQWQITRKFQRHFEQVPAHLEPSAACMYAEVLRLGGSAVEFERLRANPAYIIDPTEYSIHPAFLPFWQDTVLWLARHRDEMSDQEAHLILTWAMHRYTESERMREQPFTLRGRSLRRAAEEALEFWQAMRRPYRSYKWQSRGWQWETVDEEGTTWSFVELTSGSQLFDEGQRLNHCVASYAGRCAAGYSAIVSLRCAGRPTITLEINPRTKQIVQARGLYNRNMGSKESRIVKLWQQTVLQPGTRKER